jgi:dienelactone hydrolase
MPVNDTPSPSEHLSIYIKGDGLAWITGTQPSSDPTPRTPLALQLALAQPDGAAAYLGRPCQYINAEASNCPSRYWKEARFGPEVIAGANQAVDALKLRFGAMRLTLVGYSGGGAVAALVAAWREDVETLVTVAGNLDHQAWTTYHRIQPLTGSLNPMTYSANLNGIRQVHFVGGKDDNITPELVQGFAERFPAAERPTMIVEPQVDHLCCWAKAWPRLVARFQRHASDK